MPHGRWRTTTFLCGLRADGLVAPLVLDGAIDGPAFRARFERMLAPALRPGDTVVADNRGSHKVAGVREAIEARGASVFPCAQDPQLQGLARERRPRSGTARRAFCSPRRDRSTAAGTGF